MIKLKVSGMTCEHCERAVTNALADVAGVEKVVAVNRENEEAIIEGTADTEALMAAVREEGYDVELSQ
ncbi:MAG: heavy-metal-associated domain-containing protein [Rhodospirillales bacterium]|nr:heavy-metal-associated domain-containing protein [Rhodospirillales bacterium]